MMKTKITSKFAINCQALNQKGDESLEAGFEKERTAVEACTEVKGASSGVEAIISAGVEGASSEVDTIFAAERGGIEGEESDYLKEPSMFMLLEGKLSKKKKKRLLEASPPPVQSSPPPAPVTPRPAFPPPASPPPLSPNEDD
ncbi:hypothetical protein TSUD_67610 [Trifolium subterraneum]|uniref:Uncharacterized protein n=1 Tax=Trifolium subterraneum TaxID=3900 RepID=A0A2Z6NEZ2_TRISU|nr:hypothetical protein TSUD_67610 [Trifolium subterraneum]